MDEELNRRVQLDRSIKEKIDKIREKYREQEEARKKAEEEKAGKIRRELEGQEPKSIKTPKESLVVFDGVHFGQTPQDLLRDPKIAPAGKAVWGVMHTFSNKKSLQKNEPVVAINRQIIANCMGMAISRTSYWLNFMHKTGWLTIVRKEGEANVYVLHGEKRPT
jgi:hypothetical protein